jgi:hypothetical protein
MIAISIKTGYRFIVLPETITDGLKVTPLFAGMELIVLASIEAALVRVTVACGVGINVLGAAFNRSYRIEPTAPPSSINWIETAMVS